LRRARVAYAIRRRRGDTLPLDAWGRPEDDQAIIVFASWSYLGSGYLDLPPGGGHRGYAAMVDGSRLMVACWCSHSMGGR